MDVQGPGTSPSQEQMQTSMQPSSPRNNLAIYGAIAVIVLAIIGAAVYFFFPQQSATLKQDVYKDKIRIGHNLWPGYLGLFIAEEKGFFAEEGLDVDVVLYPGFAALSEAYFNGDIQARASLTVDAIDEAYKGLDHKVVTVMDHSNGADGIIAKKGIETIQDIKGKKVAFEHGTVEELLLLYALEQADMTREEITPVDLDPEKAAQALVDGSVDVAVTFEPFMSEALSKVPSTKIYSSAQAAGLISDILTFRAEFVNENPETLQAILRAYFKAVEFWKSNSDEANTIIGKYLNISGDEVRGQLEGIRILDARDNLTAFTFSAGFESLYGNLRRTNDFIRRDRYMDLPKVNTDTLIDDDFIKKITE